MAGLSLSLLVVVGLATWVLLREEPYVAPRPDAGAEVVRPAAAARSLQLLTRAVESSDPAMAADAAPEGDQRAADLLRALVGNADALRVRDFSLRYLDESGAADGDTWSAAVDATWRFAGYDETSARAEVEVRFAGPDAGIVAVGGVEGVSPVWLAGPVTVRRTPDVLVIAAGSGAAVSTAAADYLARGRAALPVVARVLPAWRGPLVLEVPATPDALDRALDAEPGDYAGVAAVTSSPDATQAPGAPVHVFLNQAEFERLRPLGAQVVVSHEAAHVATDATGSQAMPQWLVEGFADYVSLRDVRLPLARTAAQVIAQVREDGPPAALPGAAQFDASTGHAGAAYESAWLACGVLAQRRGEAALVGLYDAVRAGSTLADALADGFGWTEQELVRAWQTRLTDLAA
ncbi:hypothetical protein [Nocardioides sp. cx-173]|uniref:hypothetical protein n=1 Tax=Nocardioides sp. cx-173 TaxID=2898796 RepID=UPI001E621FD9|nr:hypothetical protein [Nocardioides sp. cx-173]MCD4524941.1 hypothetical protein [Nocardioides sp. cx-173]UGB43440.1 hypothetical protein LQ940_07905 [Nocardioides sp. cx-173]